VDIRAVAQNPKIYRMQTEAAVDRFNELREDIAVGGLFLSTC